MTRRDLALLAAVYIAWLGCEYLVAAAATGARTSAELVQSWVRFDGIYFRAIAEFGYDEASRIIRWQQGFPFLTAAFPLFPLLIHLAVPLFNGNYTAAAVAVPQTLTFLVLVALFRLVRLDFSRTAAWFSTLSLLTFPTFYFLLAPYSETIFLLLVILVFHEARVGRRGLAGLLGGLATAARIVGAPLLLGTFCLDGAYQLWRARRTSSHREAAERPSVSPAEGSASADGQEASAGTRWGPLSSFRLWRERAFAPGSAFILYPPAILIPLGLVVYMLYQWWEFGSPLVFLRGHASSEWKVGFDPLGPLRSLLLPVYSLLARDWTSDVFRTNLFNALFFYFGIVLTIYAFRKLRSTYAFYALLALIVPTLSGSLISMPRFLLIAFPVFVGMGVLLEAHPRLRWLLVLPGAAGLAAAYLFFQTVFLG